MKLLVALAVLAGCDQLFGLKRLGDAAPPDSLDDGLVAHYTFDDATWADVTGNGHTGACVAGSCPTLVAGHTGSAASFDGIDDHVDVASAAELGTNVALTVALWLYVDGSATAEGCPINKLHAGTDSNSYQLCVQGELLAFYTHGLIDTGVTVDMVLTPNAWHHIALRHRDADDSLSFDGVEIGVAVGATEVDSSELLFGADIDSGSPIAFFRGLVDEVRIYNRALSSSEIALLAAQ